MASQPSRLSVKRGSSSSTDARQAVRELSEQISQPDMSGVVFFCSSAYNLDELGPALQAAFPDPVIGCTSAGEVTSAGYSSKGIVGASLSSSELVMHPSFISPLAGQDATSLRKLTEETKRKLQLFSSFDPHHMFNLLLIDGLALQEERLTALLYHAYNEMPLIGGSAGDELDFKEAKVYHEGAFHSNAAVITLFETNLPFRIFISQHFEETSQRLVITAADPSRRIVTEINGRPAAQEYASLVGVEVGELTPGVFSQHPLLLRAGGQYYVRSIQQVNADGGLTFFCAIDQGMVLRVARALDPIQLLAEELELVKAELPEVQLIIGCDCILRRLEIKSKGLDNELSQLLEAYSFIGLNTYGEQYQSVHVNQTITGVAIGG